MTKPAESYDRQVLEELLEKHSGRLSENQLEAFTEMLGQAWLSKKQSDWVLAVAEKLGVVVPEAENAFSELPPEKQAEHRKMVRTELPWERGDYARPMKPPGKGK